MTPNFYIPFHLQIENKKDCFLNESLSNLVKCLNKEDFYYCTDKDLQQKGIYPYEYMSNFDKFNETCLPSKDKFYSMSSEKKLNLSNEKLSDDVKKEIEKELFSDEKNDPLNNFTIPNTTYNNFYKENNLETEKINQLLNSKYNGITYYDKKVNFMTQFNQNKNLVKILQNSNKLYTESNGIKNMDNPQNNNAFKNLVLFYDIYLNLEKGILNENIYNKISKSKNSKEYARDFLFKKVNDLIDISFGDDKKEIKKFFK